MGSIRHVLDTTFWAAALSFCAAGLMFLRGRARAGPAHALRSLARWVGSPLVLLLLGVGSVLHVGWALYLAYEEPRDLMQDIVSARELVAGRSAYPPEMRELIRHTLEEASQPPSLGRWWPRLKAAEREEFGRLVSSHWVQAHPPFMTLCFVPLTVVLGVRGTCIVVGLVSVASLALTLLLLRRILLALAPSMALMLAFAVVGWSAVTSAFRNGQSGLLLACLMTIGWLALRRGRDTLSGAAVGVAACLKLYPSLLLPYLLLRRPRAFAVAALTFALLGGLPAALVGVQIYRDYFRTADSVVAVYAGLEVNLSLLGLLVRAVGEHRLGLATDERLFAALAGGLGPARSWAVAQTGIGWRRGAGRRVLDVRGADAPPLPRGLAPLPAHSAAAARGCRRQ